MKVEGDKRQKKRYYILSAELSQKLDCVMQNLFFMSFSVMQNLTTRFIFMAAFYLQSFYLFVTHQTYEKCTFSEKI